MVADCLDSITPSKINDITYSIGIEATPLFILFPTNTAVPKTCPISQITSTVALQDGSKLPSFITTTGTEISIATINGHLVGDYKMRFSGQELKRQKATDNADFKLTVVCELTKLYPIRTDTTFEKYTYKMGDKAIKINMPLYQLIPACVRTLTYKLDYS